MYRRKITKKGQVFTIAIIVAVTGALIASFFLLKYMYEPKSEDEFLGSYQSAIIDALADGDKTLLYVDQAAKMAVGQALDEYINSNSPMPKSLGKSTEGISEDETKQTRNCGNYVYKLWNNEDDNCFPENYLSKDFELNSIINKNLIDLNYLKTDMKEPLYIDRVLKQNIKYTYSYDANIQSTKIYGFTQDRYTLGVFRDDETKKNSDIQQYIQTKSAFNGELIWPLKDNYNVLSCYGFRGVIDAGPAVSATVNHAGIDVPAPLDTPVYAAADGIISEQPVWPAWGIIIIDHGNGLKTSYTHLNSVDVKLGDRIKQGQKIGTVGGRGKNGPNDYGNHLHFAVISSTVDPNTNYDGVKAVVIGKNGDRYVNPICFITSEQQSKITFSTEGLACNSICYQPGSVECLKNKISPNFCQDMSSVKCLCSGNTAYSKTTCSVDNSDSDSPPFKFCSVYQGVTTKEIPCAKSSKADWEIVDVKLSDTVLKSDQTLKISMTIKNKGTTCVNVKQQAIIETPDDASDSAYNVEGGSVNSYKSTDTVPYAISELSCTFTSDIKVKEEAEKIGKCVLLVSDKPIRYEISTLSAIDYNGKSEDYKKELGFTVTKSTNQKDAGFVPLNIQMTPSEQSTIDKTRENLEKLGVMDEIARQSTDTGVPQAIILATITYESAGENLEIDIPKTADSGNRGIGIKQIEAWQHYDLIASTCGKDYVSECSQFTKCDLTKTATQACGEDLADTCTFTKFHEDPICQVKVGAKLLKKNFDLYAHNDAAYTRAVNSKRINGDAICNNEEFRKKYLSYTEWERALRAYNGFGCDPGVSNYVETVMRYAAGWNLGIEYVSTAKDEADKGILATYKIRPEFIVDLNFDMRLFELLKDFSNETIVKCGRNGQDKKACVQQSVKDFNIAISKYSKKGVELSTTCDETPEIAAVNKFIEEVNNCASSGDNHCQCMLTPSDQEIIDIKSTSDYTVFKYDSGLGVNEVYLDYNISEDDQKLLSMQESMRDNVYIKELQMYKDSDGSLIMGVKPLLRTCSAAKNKFRFCLKTNYQYSTYDSIDQKIETKSVKIPFALQIRDQIPPGPIKGISAQNLEHANSTIMLKWNKNNETDTIKYNIYFSEDETAFQRPTSHLRTTNYVSVSNNPEHYETYKHIDINSPNCILQKTFDSFYCIFEYPAIDKEGRNINITLNAGSTYYLSDTDKFMHILTSKGFSMALPERKEFIAITAIDVDDNEIDNSDGSSFILGENLIDITPEDKLEPGITQITSYNFDDTANTLQLTWSLVDTYIDGSRTAESINYDIYLEPESCIVDQLNNLSSSAMTQITTQELNIQLELAKPTSTQNYCVYVVPKIFDKGYMQGFAKSIIVGEGVGQQSGTGSIEQALTPNPSIIPIYYFALFD